jgi:hypoxanthine phosphoribosyltransferase
MILALTIFFGITTVIGLFVSIYYGRRTAQLRAQIKSLDWTDLKIGAGDLANKIKDKFSPDVIFTPAIRGGIIAFFISDVLPEPVPIFVGLTQWRENPQFQGPLDDYDLINTSKWNIHIPHALYRCNQLKLLIVDDLALGGDAMLEMKGHFISKGFNADAVKTMTLVATEVAIQNRKAPDFFWRSTDSPQFFFPWGKAR